MNSRLLLALLVLALVGTTWLLLTLVRIPPVGGERPVVPDTAAVADAPAVVYPPSADTPRLADSLRAPPDTAAAEGADAPAGEGGRP